MAFGPLMATFDSSAVNVSLPTIARHFNALLTEVEWVVTGYLLALGLLLLPLGILGDRWGKKKLFRIGILAFISSSVFCAITQNVYQLIFCRILQGMSGAIFISIAPAILVDSFPASERGKAMGLMGMCVSLGLMLGAPMGGILTHYFSWRSIFFVNLPIGILGFFLSEKFLKEDEKYTEVFKFEWALFKNRFFIGGNLSLFFYFLSLFILYFLTPFYLTEVLHFSPQKVGLTMMTFSAAFAVMMPISGWLSDHVGSRLLSPLGLFLSAIIYVWIAQLTETATSQEVIVRLLCLGLASGLFQAPNNSALMGAVSKQQLGTASAFMATMRTWGLMLGVFLATLIFTFRVKAYDGLGPHFSAHDVPAPLFVMGYHDTLLFAAGIIVLSIFFSLLRGPKH
ncbi:MAG: MFS transporter [Deltaproteobacteria bacterium]|nr:MFS transporter [Deltaproteobacteria bacterium]